MAKNYSNRNSKKNYSQKSYSNSKSRKTYRKKNNSNSASSLTRLAYQMGLVKKGVSNPNSALNEAYNKGLNGPQKKTKKPLF